MWHYIQGTETHSGETAQLRDRVKQLNEDRDDVTREGAERNQEEDGMIKAKTKKKRKNSNGSSPNEGDGSKQSDKDSKQNQHVAGTSMLLVSRGNTPCP